MLIEALGSAVSGLQAQQTDLNVISNNIANANTTGFKDQTVLFKDVFYRTLQPPSGPNGNLGSVDGQQSGLGVAVGQIFSDFRQGPAQVDGVPSHVMVQGPGFFMVQNPCGNPLYTRDGSFVLDHNDLVDAQGNHVQGWVADANGNINTTVQPPVNIHIPIGEKMSAKATQNIKFAGMLDTRTPVNGSYTTSEQLFDSLGASHIINVTMTKVSSVPNGPSTWTWSTSMLNDSTASTTSSGTVTYDANGQPLISSGTAVVSLNNGSATTQSVNLDFSGTANLQVSDTNGATLNQPASTMQAANQDGFEEGTLQSYSIDRTGTIQGTYTNGQTQALGQLALATFNNPGGLSREGNNDFSETPASGQPLVGTAPCNAGTAILSGALEQSNVDLSSEFAKMIVAQRAFQANSRTISVADDVLQQTLSIIRQ